MGFFDRKEDRFHRKRKRDEEHQEQLPTDDDILLPPPVDPIQSDKEPGRNDPCPCGSGKKYKKCCATKKGDKKK